MTDRTFNNELGIELKVTDRCNQSCFHCMNNDSTCRGNDLDPDIFLVKFAEWLVSSKNTGIHIREVRMTGGEPLMCPDAVMQIAGRCKQAGISSGINTNASLLTSETARQLQEVGIETIKISLDAANDKTLKRIRGKNASLPRIMQGVKNAAENEFRVILRFTACQLNSDQLIPCYEIGREMGVDIFQIKPLIPAGRGFSSNAFLGRDKLYATIEMLEKHINKNPGPSLEVLCLAPDRTDDHFTRICGSIDKIYIKTNLDIINCNYLADSKPVGNMLLHEFSDILTKRVNCITQFRNSINVLANCPQFTE